MRPYLLPLLLLSSFAASSQATSKLPARPVCLTIPEAEALRDSLRHLPTVRREAQEWQRAYQHAQVAADTSATAARLYHSALQHSQQAFAGQQSLLNDERAQKEKFRARAHRKGVVIGGLLAVLAALVFTR